MLFIHFLPVIFLLVIMASAHEESWEDDEYEPHGYYRPQGKHGKQGKGHNTCHTRPSDRPRPSRSARVSSTRERPTTSGFTILPITSDLPNPTTSNVVPDPTTSGASPSGSSAPPTSCDCGYVLTAHDNTYFPYHKAINFESLPDGPLSSSEALEGLGLRISDGEQIGGAGEDGTVSRGDYRNFAIDSEKALEMTVPGGQTRGGQITGAEFATIEDFLHGVFTASVKFDATPGTCQSVFTYHNEVGSDEQDIEILGQTIFDTMDNGTPPGIQLTNWDPSDESNTRSENKIEPFSTNPTIAYHNYTIAWLPGLTKYYFNNQTLDLPTKYPSTNPSKLFLNHWSNGDRGFTQGPPTADVVYRVKSLDLYYRTPDQRDPPQGCTVESACSV